ncbi:MAG: DinB family protein [Planctomycetota bacterium]|jgi:uncharacterized damage-inducible protein DinB
MADGFLIRLLRHNAWATRVLLERCRGLTETQFTRVFEIGPGSLHDTLLHIVGAMWRWTDRISGRADRPFVEKDRRLTPDEIINLLDTTSSELETVMKQVVDGDRLDENMEVVIRGQQRSFVFTRGTAIVHVLTHGVHHRAQALNMLRRLGVSDLPEIDAIEWEVGGGRD